MRGGKVVCTRAEDFLLGINTSIPLKFQAKHLLRTLNAEEEQDEELKWWRDFLTIDA